MTAPACAVDGSCCGPWSSCCEEYDPHYVLEYSLRTAMRSDLESVQRLLTMNKLPLDGVEQFIGEFVVAEAAGRTVGCIGIERYGDYSLLRSAAVLPGLQGRGIGRALVSEIIVRADGAGAKAMFLLTTTAESYFPSFGFSPVERGTLPPELNASAELQGACPASAIVMRKELQ
jgi:amino-acid N-acetyltransferase